MKGEKIFFCCKLGCVYSLIGPSLQKQCFTNKSACYGRHKACAAGFCYVTLTAAQDKGCTLVQSKGGRPSVLTVPEGVQLSVLATKVNGFKREADDSQAYSNPPRDKRRNAPDRDAVSLAGQFANPLQAGGAASCQTGPLQGSQHLITSTTWQVLDTFSLPCKIAAWQAAVLAGWQHSAQQRVQDVKAPRAKDLKARPQVGQAAATLLKFLVHKAPNDGDLRQTVWTHMKNLKSLTGTQSTEMQTVVFDSNEAGILHQHLRADSHEVVASKGFILAHCSQLNLAEQEKFLRLLQHATHTFPGLQSVNANGGFWHHQKDQQDRVALSEFIISSLALELASDQLADAWGMHLGSAADVSCFREALAVNWPSSLLVRYEPELNITHRPDHLRLLENQSSSLITSHKAQLPECGYYNDEGDEQITLDYRLCPAVNQDASLCSMGSASAVSQSDDWCGACIRRRPERLSMSPAVDAGAIIVSELGTSVPWHVEDNCRSDSSIAIIHVDRPCKAT
ncbi:Lysine-specific demethylase 4B [Trebouxia sp. C0009 RCD-2024]